VKDRPVGETGLGGRKKREWRRLGYGFIGGLGFVFMLSFFRVSLMALYIVCVCGHLFIGRKNCLLPQLHGPTFLF